jgi:cellulose synthase/poly-beta-1,6-N-acetylglucosamine synthase-like glycosyltransferase
VIPVTVVAKNEARAIGPCLDALLASCAAAPEPCEVLVVLDDTTDDTAKVVEARGVRWVTSSGGKVRAQRRGLREAPYNVFADADILLEPPVIGEMMRAMQDERIQVAVPHKQPLPPRRTTPLALGLHRYNRRTRVTTRRWFSGKLFAIRAFELPVDAIVDDMLLSQRVEPESICVTPSSIWFRAPETFSGMYAYYRRMRAEAERIGERFGGQPPGLIETPPIVRAALLACRARYRLERLTRRAPAPWTPIEETKWL